MNKKEKKEFDKQLKLCKLLGAEQFQDLVFKVERLKFKLIKKFIPNYIKKLDKVLDQNERKKIKKAKTSKEIKEIKRETKFAKMEARREFYQEKNKNYHINKDRPTEIYKYLEWNKGIHIRGLVKNAVLISLVSALVSVGMVYLIPILVYEVFSTVINFECVNIQNYNICRYKQSEKALQRREKKVFQKNIEEYGQISEVIDEAVEESENLPSFEEIIDKIKTPEQLRQMKTMLLHEYEARQNQKMRGK